METREKQRRYSLVSRLIGVTACMALLVIGLVWWLSGFSLFIAAAAAVALTGLLGPAVVEGGGGILEVLSGLVELIVEALGTLLEAICSIFSGF